MHINIKKALALLSLVIAGEIIFSLPFHIPRFFRPTLMDAFELSHTDLGDAFVIYGITAMIAYFPGGALADRFSARNLLVISLIATAAGGLYLAQFPKGIALKFLFAYWGVTTIFLFWAAMIKTMRNWGSNANQGRAFGLLEGGRGFVAAIASSIALLILTTVGSGNSDATTIADQQASIQSVIYFYSITTMLSAIFIFFAIPRQTNKEYNNIAARNSSISNIRQTLKNKKVWAQAAIVVCAYCGYKGLDNLTIYMVDVMYLSKNQAESYATYFAYIRPITAIIAGFAADRFSARKIILTAFLCMMVAYMVLVTSTMIMPPIFFLAMMVNLVFSFVAVFAVRAVYFALLEESKIAKNATGTAVGVISLVGFTPDIFFASITGRILDASPGAEGHMYFYLVLTVIAILGLLSTIILNKLRREKNT